MKEIEITDTDLNGADCQTETSPENDICRIEQELEYSEFFNNFLLRNRPCLFSSKFTAGWASRRDWVSGGERLAPNLAFIESLLEEDVSVPVSDCNSRVRLYDARCKISYNWILCRFSILTRVVK